MTVTLRVTKKGDAEKRIKKLLKDLADDEVVRVGFPKGTSSMVLNKAVWNEFGTSRGIPERPFMRNAINNNKDVYARLIKNWARDIIRGEITMEMALNRLGLKAVGDIQKEIVALRSPPNAPSTIEKKGSSNPLINTGEMRQKVTHKLGREG